MNLFRARFANTDREAGFTLIELLIVMLVMALLASIAMPSFLNQRHKATDSKAKQMAHTVQVAMETCNTSNNGTYSATACALVGLRAIEPTIPATGVEVKPNEPTNGYTITITAPTNNKYSIKRETTGLMAFKCTVASTSARGGCPGAGTESSWG